MKLMGAGEGINEIPPPQRCDCDATWMMGRQGQHIPQQDIRHSLYRLLGEHEGWWNHHNRRTKAKEGSRCHICDRENRLDRNRIVCHLLLLCHVYNLP